MPSWAAETALELAAIAVGGISLSQAAFSAGARVESRPVSTMLEPTVGVLPARHGSAGTDDPVPEPFRRRSDEPTTVNA